MISREKKKKRITDFFDSLLLFFPFVMSRGREKKKDRQVCFIEIEKYNERENPCFEEK